MKNTSKTWEKVTKYLIVATIILLGLNIIIPGQFLIIFNGLDLMYLITMIGIIMSAQAYVIALEKEQDKQ